MCNIGFVFVVSAALLQGFTAVGNLIKQSNFQPSGLQTSPLKARRKCRFFAQPLLGQYIAYTAQCIYGIGTFLTPAPTHFAAKLTHLLIHTAIQCFCLCLCINLYICTILLQYIAQCYKAIAKVCPSICFYIVLRCSHSLSSICMITIYHTPFHLRKMSKQGKQHKKTAHTYA